MTAVRLADGGEGAIDPAVMSYWKMPGGTWRLYIPRCGIGNLANHAVTEHDDGTISVQPSVLLMGHDVGKRTTRYGFLDHGEWREAGAV
jgi:hypothetical protein